MLLSEISKAWQESSYVVSSANCIQISNFFQVCYRLRPFQHSLLSTTTKLNFFLFFCFLQACRLLQIRNCGFFKFGTTSEIIIPSKNYLSRTLGQSETVFKKHILLKTLTQHTKIKIITYLCFIKEYNTVQCSANSGFKKWSLTNQLTDNFPLYE